VVASLISCAILAATVATAVLAAPPKSAGAKKAPAAAIAAGKKIYAAKHCEMCHKIAGKGGATGTDLSKEGANAKHTAAWLQIEVQDPKQHKPTSSMPSYKDDIKGADLTNLVAYLRSLK
jgi:mono/diheme cytochrome c family protein